jgi:hypothetical protein
MPRLNIDEQDLRRTILEAVCTTDARLDPEGFANAIADQLMARMRATQNICTNCKEPDPDFDHWDATESPNRGGHGYSCRHKA